MRLYGSGPSLSLRACDKMAVQRACFHPHQNRFDFVATMNRFGLISSNQGVSNLDAIKILKGLLGNKLTSRSGGGLGGRILKEILGRTRRLRSQPQPQKTQHRADQDFSDLGEDLFGSVRDRYQSQSPEPERITPSIDSPAKSGLGDMFQQAAEEQVHQRSFGNDAAEGVSAARAEAESRGASASASASFDSPSQQDEAVLMVRAMINAAKADGQIDSSEYDSLIKQLGDVTHDEIEFLRREFATPLNVAEFARTVPSSHYQQIYAISVTAIDLDTNSETRYLHELAQCFELSPQKCNAIHDYFKAPRIYE